MLVRHQPNRDREHLDAVTEKFYAREIVPGHREQYLSRTTLTNKIGDRVDEANIVGFASQRIFILAERKMFDVSGAEESEQIHWRESRQFIMIADQHDITPANQASRNQVLQDVF
ncbi:hypothetical protein GALL_533970 [mine drainage metagenome]|uniref:Uncharacterized protein n=1 Tax=mine drainage metagenome TaxID=410659 RepID=A0A1J5P1R1_9ZZZZ